MYGIYLSSHLGINDLAFMGLLVVEDIVLGDWGIYGLNWQIEAFNNVIHI